MSVRIRLRRMGAKKSPFYRIVVADSRTPRGGRYIETLGTYDPISEPPKIQIQEDKLFGWLNNGAQPSDPVWNLMTRLGLRQKWEMLKQGQDVSQWEPPSPRKPRMKKKAEAAEKSQELAAEGKGAAESVVAKTKKEKVLPVSGAKGEEAVATEEKETAVEETTRKKTTKKEKGKEEAEKAEKKSAAKKEKPKAEKGKQQKEDAPEGTSSEANQEKKTADQD